MIGRLLELHGDVEERDARICPAEGSVVLGEDVLVPPGLRQDGASVMDRGGEGREGTHLHVGHLDS